MSGKMDEANGLFKNSPKLIEIFKSVIKKNSIEIDGVKWPIETLINKTSNAAELKIFYSNDFHGHWVGGAAVIVAQNEDDARLLFEKELEKHGLAGESFSLHELVISRPMALILRNGDY